ncbi:MAG: hypothetical protein HRT68_11445 [Flavobacteriaceae bacterium]|nr:hypothetical protein [Flavobacteriaceae bacterium]
MWGFIKIFFLFLQFILLLFGLPLLLFELFDREFGDFFLVLYTVWLIALVFSVLFQVKSLKIFRDLKYVKIPIFYWVGNVLFTAFTLFILIRYIYPLYDLITSLSWSVNIEGLVINLILILMLLFLISDLILVNKRLKDLKNSNPDDYFNSNEIGSEG